MFKIKLANRFNTIEWEVEELPAPDDLNAIYKLLESIEIAGKGVEVGVKEEEEKKPSTELATEKQVEVLLKMGYKKAPMMTKREAWEIISKAFSK